MEDAREIRKLCMALASRIGSYEYIVTQPVYEILNMCAAWKELQEK